MNAQDIFGIVQESVKSLRAAGHGDDFGEDLGAEVLQVIVDHAGNIPQGFQAGTQNLLLLQLGLQPPSGGGQRLSECIVILLN